MEYCCIVLFKDGCMQIYRNIRIIRKSTFRKDARFFKCRNNILIDDICTWIARGYVSRQMIEFNPED